MINQENLNEVQNKIKSVFKEYEMTDVEVLSLLTMMTAATAATIPWIDEESFEEGAERMKKNFIKLKKAYEQENV